MPKPKMPAPGLVHGVGPDLVEPDWPPLTDEEVQTALALYPIVEQAKFPPRVSWHSPRPNSAAALVHFGNTTVFIKRHDPRARSQAQLAEEHALGHHLRLAGIAVPAVLQAKTGATAVVLDGYVYEVHEAAEGTDLYRDAMSWTPYLSLGQARSAGAALARFHAAARRFRGPRRRPGVLMTSCDVVTAEDPRLRLGRLLVERPGLGDYVRGRRWEDDLETTHLPAIRRAAPLLRQLPAQWSHGDWHPSNLTWTSTEPSAEVAVVFDLGLANKTFAVHDLATALERATINWLELLGGGRAEADLDAVAAFLDGYTSQRHLSALEWSALAEVVPVVHLEYALSEVEYFAAVVGHRGNADIAYDGYFLGHTRWFETPAGAGLIDYLRRRASGST